MVIDFFLIYRLLLTGLSVYNVIRVARSVAQYKPMYDRIPLWVRRFLADRGREFFGRALLLNRVDLAINLGLLMILIVLTLISWLI
ncbi:MAG: hypothetical protein EAZ61_07950 [Oscillatoriales cyanobacterium]|jgi:hypothetical protein|nr:MAG: hypothetical protein EAZ61_07950 [Oscillatoriales cyanobacterium]